MGYRQIVEDLPSRGTARKQAWSFSVAPHRRIAYAIEATSGELNVNGRETATASHSELGNGVSEEQRPKVNATTPGLQRQVFRR
jgi:hypothetical protein